MSVTWSDIADQLESRARRLSVPDDIGDLVLSAYGCLQQLVETYDIAAYVVHNDAMFATRAGERRCMLPEDFGRLLHPRDELGPGVVGTGTSGLWLWDGTNRPFPLRYQEPVAFRSAQNAEERRPTTFTLSGRQLLLDPLPDAVYTGQGVYVAQVARPDLDLQGEVLLDEPQFLVSATLYQIAADRGIPQAQSLEKEHLRQLSSMVNNAARLRQKFHTATWASRR
jgi:hypothetical protein